MNHEKLGNIMMIAAITLSIFTVFTTQALTEQWVGLLSSVFFLYAAGLTITAYGKSTSKQQANHREVAVRLDSLEEQIQKGLNEQKGTHSTIVPTLQAFSQLYLDYMAKHKSEKEQQNDRNDEESSKETSNEAEGNG